MSETLTRDVEDPWLSSCSELDRTENRISHLHSRWVSEAGALLGWGIQSHFEEKFCSGLAMFFLTKVSLTLIALPQKVLVSISYSFLRKSHFVAKFLTGFNQTPLGHVCVVTVQLY